MMTADFFDDSSDEYPSSFEHADRNGVKSIQKMTLRAMNNRNPSAILDPETVEAENMQERKIMTTVILVVITFVLCLLLFILLIVHWIYMDNQIDGLRKGELNI